MFSDASDDLCDALALCARRLATEFVDPQYIGAYLASRLVPLDKRRGVRGIGEVLRRIIGSPSILSVIGRDIQSAAGSLQLCAGQDCGIEAAVHAMTDIFNSPDTDGVLMAVMRLTHSTT